MILKWPAIFKKISVRAWTAFRLIANWFRVGCFNNVYLFIPNVSNFQCMGFQVKDLSLNFNNSRGGLSVGGLVKLVWKKNLR